MRPGAGRATLDSMLERSGRVAGVAVLVGVLRAAAAAATGSGTVTGRVDAALRPSPRASS